MVLALEKKEEEVMEELAGREKEVQCLSKAVDRRHGALIERRKEGELVGISFDQLEEKEKELRSFDEALKEKWMEVEKKEEMFEAKEKARAEEMERKSKFLELREKKLEEMMKEFDLKQGGLQNPLVQGETSNRIRVKHLVEKCSARGSLIRPAKRHKSLREHSHDYEEKETYLAAGVSATSSMVQKSQVHEGEIEEVFSVDDSDDSDEDPEPVSCVDPEFNDFEISASSFKVGQVWALYDPEDAMPRLYARIKNISKSPLSFQVTWLESRDDESVDVACGRFKYFTETITSRSMFSHEVHPVSHGRNFMAVTPEKGETWAIFRNLSKSWDNNPEQQEPPYEYDFVEVLHNFDDKLGIGVAYLGKVDGFVSIFTHAVQHEVFSFFVTPDDMHKFSHKIPSFRMTGEEKHGVPPGSFELDPAAIPDSLAKPDHSTSEEAKETESQCEDCDMASEVPLAILN